MKGNKKNLGEILISKKLITYNDLDKALENMKKTGFRLGHSLIQLNLVDENELAKILTGQCEQECSVIEDVSVPKNIINKISYEFCAKNKCIPIGVINNEIITALADPYDIDLIDDLKFLTGQEVRPQFATENSIFRAIEKTFKGKSPTHTLKTKKSDSHIVNAVNHILFDAIEKGASDIHIESFESKVNLRYRMDGELHYEKGPNKKDIASIISRIKIMANLDIAEKRLSQDGRIIIKDKEHDVDIRVSIIPTIYGENIVLRILDKKKSNLELNTLGLAKKDEIVINDILKKSFGLILITGPTGSGKTTTLYSMLKILSSPVKKIITIEDPVEYKIENVNQVEVNPKIDLTFASALRSFLRHDPDIIMVGEIRDKETAEIAIRAGLTGHLVLSTVHTNDAASAVARMLDMGIEPFLLASTLKLIISQRLVRKICDKCKTKAKKNNKVIYTGKGCAACNKSGYKGRSGIFEVMAVDEKIQDAINKKKTAMEIKAIAKKAGFYDLSQDGLEKVKQGLTSEEEILKVINL